MLQLNGNTLAGLRRGDQGILEALDLPEDEARRLMELGFIPGSPVTVGQSAPGGDPAGISGGRLGSGPAPGNRAVRPAGDRLRLPKRDA